MTAEQLIAILTDTVDHEEPDCSEPNQVIRTLKHIRHYCRGNALTMLPKVRLDNIHQLVSEIYANSVPGDLLEAGVWRGGATIFMRWLLNQYQDAERSVWVVDSFQGFPKTGDLIDRKTVDSLIAGEYSIAIDDVKASFAKFGLLDNQVTFVKGYFDETLPTIPVKQLSLLRIDADLYDSTKVCLDNLYPKLSSGGFVIIDDYGETEYRCHDAVDEYRENHNIHSPIIHVDDKCIFWRKQ